MVEWLESRRSRTRISARPTTEKLSVNPAVNWNLFLIRELLQLRKEKNGVFLSCVVARLQGPLNYHCPYSHKTTKTGTFTYAIIEEFRLHSI